MDRLSGIAQIEEWRRDIDILVIGGGATGLGVGVDGASRGFRTVVLEQHDFGKGTSSRSTKLVHGGVRYLKQGKISLVMDALRERELLWHNAPHLVHPLRFVLPTYSWVEKAYYSIGLKSYDLLASGSRFGRSRSLNKKETLDVLPTLRSERLHGAIEYFDGQFDDARMLISLAQTMVDHGGVPLNYFKVERLLKEQGKISGVIATDLETGKEFELRAKVVVNATGVFTDAVRQMDHPEATPILTTSQGAHVVLDRSFLPGSCALMVPKTSDGRVLFAIPWHGYTLVGTTDNLVNKVSLEPRQVQEEIAFLLETAGKYLHRAPSTADVLSTFAGLRPLVKSNAKSTAETSRDHTLLVSDAGLVSITGGKWTTYRRMAEQTVDRALEVAELEKRSCRTRDLKLHGWTNKLREGWEQVYGEDIVAVDEVTKENPAWAEKLHSRLPYRRAEVIWAARKEMARRVEDILARRTRALFQDAKASMEAAPVVGKLLAKELGKTEDWQAEEVRKYEELAAGYLPGL